MSKLDIPATLSVARKDIKVLLRQRSTLVYLVVIPVVFVLGFSGAGKVGSDPKEEVIPLHLFGC